jgi:hypothetical protein
MLVTHIQIYHMAQFQKMYQQGELRSNSGFRLIPLLYAFGMKKPNQNPERLWRYGAVMRPEMVFDIGG